MIVASVRTLLAAAVLLGATPTFADTQFVYDSSGRLIKAVYSNGVTIEYRYDAAGNRTQIITSNAPNTAPVAANDSASVGASQSVNIQVRGNDSDANGNTLTVTNVGTPTGGGSVAIQGGGTYVRYTAPATTGNKTFTYTISDGAGGSASATVSVTVSTANTAPVAVDDQAEATVNATQAIYVVGNDEDVENHPRTVTAVSGVSGPVGASATIGSGGTFVNFHAPGTPGTYTFTYTVSDGNGGTDTGLVTVEVTLGEGCVPTSEDPCDAG